MKSLSKEIKAYALKNALEFGKADPARILPKLFQHGLEKSDIKNIMPIITEIAKEVNSLSQSQKEKEFESLKSLVKEHEERAEGELPDLEGAIENKVTTRLAPEPSKYNHIGHALVFLIQYLYAKKYNGKCILRFDDTNPEKSSQEYYDAMKEDLSWLGIKWDKEIIASNNLPTLYKYAEQLIKENHAFVCSCPQEEVKQLREKMKACKCRKNTPEANLKEWNLMLNKKYKEGERTLRLKGDMKSNNGVMRDPIIFRISLTPHFIQKDKYSVWPMYDFENPIEDSLTEVTHVIRTNEFELRAELHEHILKLLKLKSPIIKEIGRYQISGAETQGRAIREMIENGKVTGWDDPRLVTVKALRRRGFVPEMFQQMATTVGLSKSGGHISPLVMESINRKIIDKIANRYSLVQNPIEIKIKNRPKNLKTIQILIHPDKKETRTINVDTDSIFLSQSDFDELKGKEIRLLHLYNIKLDSTKPEAEFTSLENKDVPRINWVSEPIPCEILMPEGQILKGLAESSIKDLKINEIIQFERNFFCKLEHKDKDSFKFVYTHK